MIRIVEKAQKAAEDKKRDNELSIHQALVPLLLFLVFSSLRSLDLR